MTFIRGTHYEKQGKSCEQRHHNDCWKMVLLVSFYLIQSRQVKHTLQDSVNELIIWKMNPQVIPMTIVSNSNWHSCMHKEQWNYFKRTSLYLVRLKIFEWIKLLRRHIYQYRETELVEISQLPLLCVSQFITHARMQRRIWNLHVQLQINSTFES